MSELLSRLAPQLAQSNLAKAYADGFAGGIKETLLQLTGMSTTAPEGCYRGPLPDELEAWVARVRRQLP